MEIDVIIRNFVLQKKFDDKILKFIIDKNLMLDISL